MLWRDGRVHEGTIAPLDHADRGLTLGDGLFDTALALDGRIAFEAAHVERLAASAEALGIPADGQAIRGAMRALAARGARLAIRTTLTRGAGPRGLKPPDDPRPTLFAVAAPSSRALAFAPLRLWPTGIARNDTSPAARHKTLGYLDAVLAAREAAAAGFDEALFCNTRGAVACAGTGNVFCVLVSATGTDAARDAAAHAPSPLCGGGWPSRQRGSGEGSAISGEVAPGAASSSVAPPLTRPPSGATLPRRGGREDGRLRLVTPPLSDGVLAGITRAQVLALAPACGLAVEERSLSLDELRGAEAVFVTNALRLLAPVTALGTTTYASAAHPAVGRLIAALRAAVARSCGVDAEQVA
ncbi:aminotransferase class IV [Methylobacterium sp. NEAU 140]|uniref:aminotransferase class IV n=1 Tax=Methylobacterium sp. NEAU 140 TaxID=3064945 RepID=UPI0027331F48|nr:aminotransferase class IV [Methylobacterium sp. NEAU 140]MDP4022901.1 aminotransferase class IV [Methylobacterium sp. NEAU 140]